MKRNDPKNCGVYAIWHRASGRVYIGSSISISERWKSHQVRASSGSMTRLHRLMREFGTSAFDFRIIHLLPKEDLLKFEKRYIGLFNSASANGLNTRKNPVATYDQVLTDATRERMRLSQLGRKHSLETRMKMSRSMTGLKRSDEARENMRKGRAGIKLSPLHCARIGESNRGKIRSEETRAKMSAGRKGKGTGPQSPESIKRRAASCLGRKHTQETKSKMSKSRALFWERKRVALARTAPKDKPE